MVAISTHIRWASGKEETLDALEAEATVEDLMLQIETTTGVPTCFQRVLRDLDEVGPSSTGATLASLGIHDGAHFGVVRMSFPCGVFEYKSSRSRGVNGFFGYGAGDVFEETEHMTATFDLDGTLSIDFKAEYDTGFQIAELKGELHARDETGNTFKACMCQTSGNFMSSASPARRCELLVSFDRRGSVTLAPVSSNAIAPFKVQSWRLCKFMN